MKCPICNRRCGKTLDGCISGCSILKNTVPIYVKTPVVKSTYSMCFKQIRTNSTAANSSGLDQLGSVLLGKF